jgi:hypothetical protein
VVTITHHTACLQVRNWLLKQVSADDRGTSMDRKRKRSTNQAETHSRSQPRPRLQDTHKISDLQKINQSPSIDRKPLAEVCKKYQLDLRLFLREIKRCSHLTPLPIAIDEYTPIDTWYSLRVHLHPNQFDPKAKMQRVRSKPAALDQAAKNDPVFYVTSEGTAVPTAKLHGKQKLYVFIVYRRVTDIDLNIYADCSIGQLRLIFRFSPTTLVPNPPLMAYLHSFSSIPRSGGRFTRLLTVNKNEGQSRHRIVPVSQLLRLCPLAPVIQGQAARDVDRDNILERCTQFYLNKYRNLDDYLFLSPDLMYK